MNQTLIRVTTILFAGMLVEFGHTQVSMPPSQLAFPAERLRMEQVRELAEAGEIDEALNALEKLLDEAEHRIVPIPDAQSAATLKTQRFIPLTQWTGLTTLRLLQRFPQAAEQYHLRKGDHAAAAMEQQQASKDVVAAERAARRYFATQSGSRLHMLLCDLYLENGWGVAACQAAQQISPLTRFRLPHEHSEPGDVPVLGNSLPSPLVWRQAVAKEKRAEFAASWGETLDAMTSADAESQLIEAASRMMIASAMNPRELDASAMRDWAQSLMPNLSEQGAERLRALLKEVASWPSLPVAQQEVSSFEPATSHSIKPTDFEEAVWPTWTQSLERYSASSDHMPASKPRVGESERGILPYFPVVRDGLVFVNEMTHIVSFDLKTGKPWPDVRPALPLFDSRISSAAYLPLGYPLVGMPRGTLEIEGNCLYARMGSPITGRVDSRSRANEESTSYLVGLDLTKQGSLLPGFPLHLRASEFSNAEFDGPPLAWGEMLLVAVAERDNVGLRRSVIACDRFTGDLIWKSGVLAVGSISGSEGANLISHQMLTIAGGRLYYNTNLGSIVCLDPLTGATEWLVKYTTPSEDRAFPSPNRYRYRDTTPCILSAGLVYCAPQDAPEIFALDATTGDLVWSTDDWQAADAVQLLGVHEDCLIASGDRLIWLDKHTGRLLSRFPASTTPGSVNALPSPRGLGRGAIADEHVYWPVAGEIFVFPASVHGNRRDVDVPPISRRIRVDTRGTEGGNLLFASGWLLMTSPSSLMAFAANFLHNQSPRNP